MTGAGSDGANAAERRDLYWLLGVTLLVIGVGLGLRDPWPADEPRFALVARDMVASGNWLFPRIGGDLYGDKPPLFFWIIAVFYQLTGQLRIAFLLPSVLSALGVIALVYDLARRMHGHTAALLAGYTLLFTLQFLTTLRGAQIDPLLCFVSTLSLYGLLRHLLLGPAWHWYFVGALAAGLGVITKGVGFLPLLVLLPYALLRRAGWAELPAIRGRWRWSVLALAGLLGGIGLWLVPMLWQVLHAGSADLIAYRDEILFKQTIDRYANAWGHVRNGYYYFLVGAPSLWMPWTVLLFWLVPAWRRAWQDRQAQTWLPLWWVLIVLLFFSFSSGKRGVYILPALPALALAGARYLPALYARVAVQRLSVWLAAVLVVAMLALNAAWRSGFGRLQLEAARNGVDSPWPLLALLIAGAAALAWGAWRKPLAALPATLGALVVVFACTLMPAMNDARSGRGFMTEVQRVAARDRPLALLAYKEQFLLYLSRPIINFGHRRNSEQEHFDAARWLNETAGAQLLVPESALKPCFEFSAKRLTGYASGEDWYLVSGAATMECARKGGTTRFTYALQISSATDS